MVLKPTSYTFKIWANVSSQIEIGIMKDLFCEMCVLTLIGYPKYNCSNSTELLQQGLNSWPLSCEANVLTTQLAKGQTTYQVSGDLFGHDQGLLHFT